LLKGVRGVEGQTPRRLSAEVQFERRAPGLSVVAVRGEHDLNSVPVLTRVLDEAVGHSNVLVDLSECSFIDSRVIGALIRASQSVHGRGEHFVVVIPAEQAHLSRIAHLTRLDAFFPIYRLRTTAEREIARALQVIPADRSGT
jgi:anti-anti-sigma factor